LDALLNDTKYTNVNRDILYALGFPLLLIAGEAERTGTSAPEFATLSPVRSMESFRDKIIEVIKDIVEKVSDKNGFKSVPGVRFAPLNLQAFADFMTALSALYTSGNLSREDYAAYLGYDWTEQMDKKEAEQKVLKEKELGEFAPAQFSPAPGVPGTTPQGQPENPSPKPAPKPAPKATPAKKPAK